MNPDDFTLTPEQKAALVEDAGGRGALADHGSVPCSAVPADHAHVMRVGRREQAHTRVRLSMCLGGGNGSIFLHPAVARLLAAQLLNAADEADGKSPLMFSPRDIAPEDLDTPGTDVE